MMPRRASYLALLGMVFALWMLAFGCSLDTTGFGDSEEACTVDVHCDDQNACTVDTCGPSGTCVHTNVEDKQYPDGVTGNCKLIDCKDGKPSDFDYPEDVDDGDDCTVDKCTESGATHDRKAGLVCHKDGGIGVCLADGSCSIDCGYIQADGTEKGCMPSPDPCSISYCDKGLGKCVTDALDGVPQPGTSPGDCGGTYCKNGVAEPQFAPEGTTCAGPDNAIVCDDAGQCVGCNKAADCDPTMIGDSYCFTAMCVNKQCDVTTKTDGTVLPMALQTVGDCKQKQCMSFKVIEVPLDADINDDMNLCTTDTCAAGNPLHTPTAPNSPCGANGTLFCDGAGSCQNCNTADQCGTDTDCLKFACDNHVCLMNPTVVNTPVMAQVAGDCLLQVCDGMGGIKPNNDNNDTPNDNNDCTLDQCSNGLPVFPPVAVGSVCSQNRICDPTGHCLGGQCSVQGDCPNGAFCVDSVCCNTACSTTCQACTNTLKGGGLNGDCGTSAPGTDNNDLDCPGATVCNGTTGMGACKLPVGQACAMPTDCLLGFCTDGFCCNTLCNETCKSCGLAGTQGTCTNIPFGMDPANECSGAINCNGTGACGNLFGNGTACMLGTECQSGFCTDGVCCSAACGGNCQSCVLAGNNGTCTSVPVEQDPNNECTGTDVCNGAGLCGKAKGTACGAGAECASGFCVDGVCCNNACGTSCKACNLAGTVGTCTNIPSGQDPATECPGATNCNGNGTCALFSNGTACMLGAECSTGNCVDGVCCNTTCTGTCAACNLAGSNGACTNIANGQDPGSECAGARVCNGAGVCVGGPNGSACAAGAECSSGNCVDGVCCNSTCATTCMACNLAGSIGTCSNIANGQDPASECAGVTVCNGAAACTTLANGTACTLNGECMSGNCIDGVCCNTACATTCMACNLAGNLGTCSNIANGQDPANECANGACNGAAACKLDNGQVCAAGSACLSGNCVDGVCCNTTCGTLCLACNVAGSVGTCTNVPGGTDPANECAGVTNCNGSGACGLLANGVACAVGGECTSGNCIDGVCCNTTCATACTACNLAGSLGTCSNIANGQDPANECANGACNGAAACKLDNGQTCAAGTACLSGNCADSVCCNSTCGTTCTACNLAGNVGTCSNIANGQDPANECPGTTTCDGAAACALLSNGAACTLGGECTSGNCVDGVCCNTTCGTTCMACNLAGSLGTCTNIPSGQDPASECVNGACNGAAACKLNNGQTCAAGSACLSGNCADTVCCNTTCAGSCQTCNGGTPGTCSNIANGQDPANECPGTTSCNGSGGCALLANGAACTLAAECTSGNCVDGVCCNTACGGTCQACDLAGSVGTCASVPLNGTDDTPACNGTNACDGTGGCKKIDGQGCSGANSECVHNACVDGFCCNVACNSTCQACSAALTGGMNGVCANLIADTDPANECAGAEVCGMMGTCVPGADGAACFVINTTDATCVHNECYDGVCCATACSGECKACSTVKTGGMDGTCANVPAGQDPDLECAGATTCNGSGACGP